MITKQSIIDFFDEYNFDLRLSNNGRWIDQKCTADVVTIVADCILNYELEFPDSVFTTKDIWHNKYTIENVEIIFKKPEVVSKSTKHEYDKFFQQPLEMLSNAQIIKKTKKGNRNFYQINNYEILEYIALREKNALVFLDIYIEKVLSDSGLIDIFESFFLTQDKKAYIALKKAFSDFTIKNTLINGIVECNRIFSKVLNPLSYFRNSKGTEKGHLSKQVITYDMLMYNRNNFRDIYSKKPKGIARKVYAETHPVEINEAYAHYQSTKAKKYLRLFNDQNRDSRTEHLETGHINDYATHMHHIFPESEYPEICYYLENLIALTPTQHLNYAHPYGRTQEINEQYQHLLLLSKADRIYENLTGSHIETIYDFSNFLFVLNIGFDNDSIINIPDMDFPSLINVINLNYI